MSAKVKIQANAKYQLFSSFLHYSSCVAPFFHHCILFSDSNSWNNRARRNKWPPFDCSLSLSLSLSLLLDVFGVHPLTRTAVINMNGENVILCDSFFFFPFPIFSPR